VHDRIGFKRRPDALVGALDLEYGERGASGVSSVKRDTTLPRSSGSSHGSSP
jgi:hypothetical protein